MIETGYYTNQQDKLVPQTAHGYSSGIAPLSGWCYILTWCFALFAAGNQHVVRINEG